MDYDTSNTSYDKMPDQKQGSYGQDTTCSYDTGAVPNTGNLTSPPIELSENASWMQP